MMRNFIKHIVSMNRSLLELKKTLKSLFCLLLIQSILLTSTTIVRADFEDLGVGARPIGMGNAFIGLSDDSRAISYNPAGLVHLKRKEFSADYGQLYTNLDDNSTISSGYFSYAMSLRRRKTLDERIIGLRQLSEDEKSQEKVTKSTGTKKNKPVASRPVTFFKDLGTLGLALSNLTLSGAVSENTFRFSYGRKIRPKLSGGLTFKLLYQSYTQDDYTRLDPVFTNGGDNLLTYAVDAGLLYNLSPKIFWGLVVTNINRPNTALSSSDRDLLPRAIKNGFAYKDKKLKTAIDIVLEDGDYRLHAGVERWIRNRSMALRLGGGFGSRDFKNVTTGFSVNWKNIQVDYAFLFPISGVQETFGNHRLSLIYRFGKAPVNELEIGSVELYYAKLKAETEILRSKLEKSEDERSRLEKVLVEEALSRIQQKVRAEKLEASVAPKKKVRRGKKTPKRLKAISKSNKNNTGIKTYVTVKGDTLQSIAKLFYGTKKRWLEIYNLNKEKVGRGGKLKRGTVLLIPGVEGVSRSVPSIIKQNKPSKTKKGRLVPIGKTLSPIKGSKGSKFKKLNKQKQSKKRTVTKYQVMQGDTLGSISKKVYGDKKLWKKIYNANKDKVEQGSVKPGTILKIP